MAKKRPFSCGTDVGNPERPRWAHFASSGSQSEHRIRFFMPTCGFNHIMRQCGIVNQLLHSNKEAYYSTFIQDNSNEVFFKTVNMPLHRNSEACLDFLKVVRLVFWSGVVGPARSLALRAQKLDLWASLRLVIHRLVMMVNLPTRLLTFFCAEDWTHPRRNRVWLFGQWNDNNHDCLFCEFELFQSSSFLNRQRLTKVLGLSSLSQSSRVHLTLYQHPSITARGPFLESPDN